MLELIEANWPVFALLLVLAVFAVVWVALGSRKARVEVEDRSPGKASAKRNQALIDAPSTRDAVMSAANNQDIAAASADADAEAGPAFVPTNSPPPGLAPAVAAAAAAPAAEPGADDLTRIKGVGPKLATQLNALGVSSFARIAGWGEAEIDRIDAQLGRFQGRIRRDQWVRQAQLLASGDIGGFEQQFGRT